MPSRLYLEGKKFGRLTVLEFSFSKHNSYWLCVCVCGKRKIVVGHHLIGGRIRSCGCLRTKHGHAKLDTKIYSIWENMLARCRYPRAPNYKNYGGRGIKICKRWNKFENFLADMGECPDGKTLDRKNNDGGYGPSNCRWATTVQQCANRRGHVGGASKYKGVSKHRDKWCARITNLGTTRFLGSYVSECEAALAYDVAAFKAWNNNAFLNFKQ